MSQQKQKSQWPTGFTAELFCGGRNPAVFSQWPDMV